MRAHKCPKYALAANRIDTARALCAQLALQVPLPKSVLIITECVCAYVWRSYCVQLRCIFMTPQTPYVVLTTNCESSYLTVSL